jgi:hypothetical protein
MASQPATQPPPSASSTPPDGSPTPPSLTIKYKSIEVSLESEHVVFVKTMLSVVIRREESCNPSFPCDSAQYLVAGDLVDYVVSCLAVRYPDLSLLNAARSSKWTDAHDRAFLKLLEAPAFRDELDGLEWTNKEKKVRKQDGVGQSGRISKTHTWSLTPDGKSLQVPISKCGSYALMTGMADAAAFNGVLQFPWGSKDSSVSSKAARMQLTDFVLLQPSEPDTVRVGIASFDLDLNSLVLVIPEEDNGRKVEIHVQQKLEPEWRAATHISGPRALCHQSGPGAVDKSDPIVLPRALARTGRHSYLKPYNSAAEDYEFDEYETELDKEELLNRVELQKAAPGKAVLTMYMMAPKVDTDHHKRKRTSAFALSPPPPRAMDSR